MARLYPILLFALLVLAVPVESAGQTEYPFGGKDITPPVVTITDPANLSIFNTNLITASGIVDDKTATVEVNGVAVVVTGETFTAHGVPLVLGVNTLTATATDPAGNVGTATIQVTLK